ncbi:Hypothetical predicted protein [Mytilus galloprovincialis]|uniref:Uncharacterized protein n=1 Tax=Mytilus galloprovincialis TaxID=29158 RepID=A0A8B6HES3_MYTGA|nr:Hypothetical predicted protein [Mytilus galloprovincialis]
MVCQLSENEMQVFGVYLSVKTVLPLPKNNKLISSSDLENNLDASNSGGADTGKPCPFIYIPECIKIYGKDCSNEDCSEKLMFDGGKMAILNIKTFVIRQSLFRDYKWHFLYGRLVQRYRQTGSVEDGNISSADQLHRLWPIGSRIGEIQIANGSKRREMNLKYNGRTAKLTAWNGLADTVGSCHLQAGKIYRIKSVVPTNDFHDCRCYNASPSTTFELLEDRVEETGIIDGVVESVSFERSEPCSKEETRKSAGRVTPPVDEPVAASISRESMVVVVNQNISKMVTVITRSKR